MFFLLFIYFSPFSICKYTFFFPYNIIIYVKTKKKLIMLILERMVTLTCASPNRKHPPMIITGKISIATTIFFLMREKPKNKLILLLLS